MVMFILHYLYSNIIFYKLLETNFNICYIKNRKEQPPQGVDFISLSNHGITTQLVKV